MVFSCCKKKKKASIESVKSIPIVKSKREPKTLEILELHITDSFVSGKGKDCAYPHVKFTPSTNEGMVKIQWKYDNNEEESISETSMDSKLSKTDGMIDVALRWFINYFETSKCSCSSITLYLNQSMTSNPDFIWSHMCFTSSKINCIHTLTCYGNGGDQNPFVFDFPEKFCNQFPKLKVLEMYSGVKITESCLLSLNYAEIVFGRETPLPEETIYNFIKVIDKVPSTMGSQWIDGEKAQPDLLIFRFNSAKIEKSIVKNLKNNVDGAILWEDDEKMAQVAKQIFENREDQDVKKSPYIKLIEFDPKKTFQFERKSSGKEKKPVTATLNFHWGWGTFVVCGILDLNISISENIGGRPNYDEPS